MSEITMPSFGADMEQGVLQQWRVKPGDSIRRNQVIAEVETQKGVIEFEAYSDGTISRLLVAEGETVPVGTPIALLDTTIEAPVPEANKPVLQPDNPLPEAEKIAAPKVLSRPSGVMASPYARRLADEQGINLSTMTGSGPAGAVLAKDLLRQPTAHAATAPQHSGQEAMRTAIASAMGRSKREIPHYYLESTLDLQRAADWLTETNRDQPPESQILLNALLHCAVARALRKSPELNGFYENGRFTPARDIHLGTGIAIRGGGLISPAILDADQLNPAAMMDKLKDLSDRVRNGKLRSSEMTSATITLSSMGDRGAERIFGIIYPPQVALVGIGRPQLRPWVVEDSIQPRLLVSVTLSADHRVSDGRQGANFLNRLNKILQKPEQL